MAARTGLVATIMGFPKAQPFAFNIIIATVKTSAADLMTQVMVEGKAYDEVRFGQLRLLFNARCKRNSSLLAFAASAGDAKTHLAG
jgi:hypothetical protein